MVHFWFGDFTCNIAYRPSSSLKEGVQVEMKKTWMPTVAGILDITSGTLQVAAALYVILSFFLQPGYRYGWSYSLTSVMTIGPLVLIGPVAIAGGIFIFFRKNWDIVYLGALAASIPLVFPIAVFLAKIHPALATISLLGIGALVLSLRAEKELKKQDNP
jgi:hypothetical protein